MPDFFDQLKNRLHDHRREARRRLIEQQQLRAAHQRAANCAHLLLAAGHGAGQLMPPFLHAREQRVDHLQPLGEPGACRRRVRTHAQVFFHRQTRKQAPVLRHLRQTQVDDLVRRHAGQRLALQANFAGGHVDQFGNRAQQRRLAGAVRADHRNGFTCFYLERDVEQRLKRAVTG